MFNNILIFIFSLAVLLISARLFIVHAEKIGGYFRLPAFVIGIFIVGIGTSLPELISGIFSVNRGVSEILSGNLIGANISNILLITGLAVVLNRKTIILNSSYIYTDLHFLLGSMVFFYVIAYDGNINLPESLTGIAMFIIYSIFLIKGGTLPSGDKIMVTAKFPLKSAGLIILSGVGSYFGADYTISSLSNIAIFLKIPNSIIALTVLSLGTTLPELVINISAIRQGKAEMALGNILGSCVFNTLAIPPLASIFGQITVPENLLGFSLPLMAACGLLFYLLTQDKRISVWEGLMFICLYLLFIFKIVTT